MKVRKGSNIQIRRLHSYEGGLIMTGDDTVENARKIIDQSNEKRIRDGWIQKPEQYQICCHEWYVYEDDAGVFYKIEEYTGVIEQYPAWPA